MRRRDFLRGAAAVSGVLVLGNSEHPSICAAESTSPAALPEVQPGRLPQWHGFNLLEKFMMHNNRVFVEDDFRMMAEWGFNFARLPMDYRCWTDPEKPDQADEKVLAEIDTAVELGEKYGVHINLCLHRAPGYTVARPAETLDLWTSEEAQRQFDLQWSRFARRYRGIPSTRLSFDLVNEPAKVSNEDYAKVVRRVVAAIRAVDPDRLIIADGNNYGRIPVFEIADLGVGQSTRGYDPFTLTHYQASWVGGADKWPEPTWPVRAWGRLEDRDWIARERIAPWKRLAEKGVGVHVGEWGVYNKTPHDVTLAFMRVVLDLWKEAGFGWSLWNLRGSFGILDSSREDVAYEDFRGKKLDRKMLELLRAYV